MASIEFLNKRIEGKQKEIDKLNKKMSRILAAEATGWEKNPYYYNTWDKERTQRDIEDAQKSLAGYEEEMRKEQEKADSRNVTAILEFLERWKDRMRTFYHDAFERYKIAYAEWRKDMDSLRKIEYDYARPKDDRKEAGKRANELYKEFHEAWGFLNEYLDHRDEFSDERFEKDIKREAEIKYDGIIERTNDICGKIIDASDLRVGEKGDIDGIVIGERGKARIQTIGAGGYNIQCYHFRVLVHKAH